MSAIYQGKIITKHISKYIHILLVHFDYQKYSFFNDENPCPTGLLATFLYLHLWLNRLWITKDWYRICLNICRAH